MLCCWQVCMSFRRCAQIFMLLKLVSCCVRFIGWLRKRPFLSLQFRLTINSMRCIEETIKNLWPRNRYATSFFYSRYTCTYYKFNWYNKNKRYPNIDSRTEFKSNFLDTKTVELMKSIRNSISNTNRYFFFYTSNSICIDNVEKLVILFVKDEIYTPCRLYRLFRIAHSRRSLYKEFSWLMAASTLNSRTHWWRKSTFNARVMKIERLK